MLSYLKGTVIGTQVINSNRVILVLDVNHIGYEIQVTSRFLSELPKSDELTQIYTHLNVREDNISLFGFGLMAERDLFRQLVAVSGIGPQLAMALIDTLNLQDLVQAIVSGNTKTSVAYPRGRNEDCRTHFLGTPQ